LTNCTNLLLLKICGCRTTTANQKCYARIERSPTECFFTPKLFIDFELVATPDLARTGYEPKSAWYVYVL
jgi:hypothetical protein